MPTQSAPVRSRHGNLHARALPINAAGPEPVERHHAGTGAARPPRRIATGLSSALMVSRCLDAGRLSASDLVAAVGLVAESALTITLAGPGRLVVRSGDAGVSVARTHTAHTDRLGRIVITASLRSWLGVEPTGAVLARLVDIAGDPAIEIIHPALVHNALDFSDTDTDAASLR